MAQWEENPCHKCEDLPEFESPDLKESLQVHYKYLWSQCFCSEMGGGDRDVSCPHMPIRLAKEVESK